MLSTNRLTIRDSIFDNVLVNDLSFSLNENDKIALIGSEGTGKSTLLKLLSGYELNYIETKGDIYRQVKPIYIEQNITYLWKDKSVYDFLFSGNKGRIDHLIQEANIQLNAFGFDYQDMIDRLIQTFSGGEKVKLSLVKALIQEPQVLLMDEPTNDLDFETIQMLESFMIQTSIPLIFISHDQRLLENVANGIIHIQHIHKQSLAKTFFYRGTYLDYKERYFRHYENTLQTAKKQREDYKTKINKFRKIYAKVEHQQNQAVRNPSLARLLKKKIHALKSQEKRFEKEKEAFIDIPEKEEPMSIFFDDQKRKNPNKQIIHIELLNFKLPNAKEIKHIELKLNGSDKFVIYGKNGIGKTSFIKAIIKELGEKQIKFAYIPQNYMDILSDKETSVEFLLKRQDKYLEYRIRQILGQLGFKRKDMDALCKDLSEGQKLKVLLLYMVSMQTEVLILDEPTRNISPINQDEIYQLFNDYHGAILAVTHDRAFIEEVFDDIYELREDSLILK